MEYKVYHAKKPTFGFGERPNFPEDYQIVAKVDCNSLEEVFQLTNHIDSNWTKNPKVSALNTSCRSTSVGDVVIDEDGKAHYCDMVGWTDI